jgi:hypothetical protein
MTREEKLSFFVLITREVYFSPAENKRVVVAFFDTSSGFVSK